MGWSVKVPRQVLLEKVKANCKTHKATVDKALVGYRNAVIKELEKRLETIRSGKKVEWFARLPEPEDHSSDYDTIIGMLELSQDEQVSLGPAEYRSYVEDKWDWSDNFAASTSSYI